MDRLVADEHARCCWTGNQRKILTTALGDARRADDVSEGTPEAQLAARMDRSTIAGVLADA
jgi:hypothetical protein